MNHSDEEILELNEYLKSITNVKCLMFMCERELGWQRESLKQNKFMTREKYDASYDGIQRLISKMNAFEVIDITN